MRLQTLEVPKPTSASDFEAMCLDVYRHHYISNAAMFNGRSGQSQHGVDIYVQSDKLEKPENIGVQCKRYYETTLTLAMIKAEVLLADEGMQAIDLLLIATTKPNDARLVQQIAEYSLKRKQEGQFAVQAHFWNEIENIIRDHSELEARYSPNSPNSAISKLTREVQSIGRHITQGQLSTNESLLEAAHLIKIDRFRDARQLLESCGSDLRELSEHDKALWHKLYGKTWLLADGDVLKAKKSYDDAYRICPNEAEIIGAHVQSLLIQEKFDEALAVCDEALLDSPLSLVLVVNRLQTLLHLKRAFKLSDVPEQFQGDPSILTLCSRSALQAENNMLALDLAEGVLDYGNPDVFVRSNYLKIVMHEFEKAGVHLGSDLLSEHLETHLCQALQLFYPFEERLWTVQSSEIKELIQPLAAIALHKQRNQDVLDLIKGALERGFEIQPDTKAIKLAALGELDCLDAAEESIRKDLAVLDQNGLMLAAQVSRHRLNDSLMQIILIEAASRFQENLFLQQNIRAKHLSLKAKLLGEVAAADMIEAEVTFEEKSIDTLCTAARIMRWAEREDTAVIYEDRAIDQINGCDDLYRRRILADWLFAAERWSEAAEQFQILCDACPPKISDAHARLLECYTRAGMRARANTLLRRLPEGWQEHAKMRQAALMLGQQAGDWRLLLPLVRTARDRDPGKAMNWFFLLHLLRQSGQTKEFETQLNAVPLQLDGESEHIRNLASLEFHFGYAERGRLRLYAHMRRKPRDRYALAMYYGHYLVRAMSSPLPPHGIGAGSWLRIQPEDADEYTVVIDPPGLDLLPENGAFMSVTDELIAPYLGHHQGDQVQYETLNREVRSSTVTFHGSAFDYYLHLAAEQLNKSAHGLPNFHMVSLEDHERPGELDFSKLLAFVQNGKEYTDDIFRLYGTGALTLSKLSGLMRKSTVEICGGWYSTGDPLFVDAGDSWRSSHLREQLELVKNKSRKFVIDSTALFELLNFKMEVVLQLFDQVLITPATVLVLEEFLDSVSQPWTPGSRHRLGTTNHGQVVAYEVTETDWSNRAKLAQDLVRWAREHCVITPVYGEIDWHLLDKTSDIELLIGHEAHEIMLLAQSENAVIITLDGRLRQIALQYGGFDGVWPQLLAYAALEKGLIAEYQNDDFAIASLRANRSFVTLTSSTLCRLLASSAEPAALHWNVQLVQRYLSDQHTSLDSVFEISCSLLTELLCCQNMPLGAYIDLFAVIVTALGWREDTTITMLRSFKEQFVLSVVHGYEYAIHEVSESDPRARMLKMHRNFIMKTMDVILKRVERTKSNGLEERLSRYETCFQPTYFANFTSFEVDTAKFMSLYLNDSAPVNPDSVKLAEIGKSERARTKTEGGESIEIPTMTEGISAMGSSL